MNKKVAVFVAKGFEDVELLGTTDIFSRNEIDFDLISIENESIVKGKFVAMVKTIKFDDVDMDSYDSIFLPGGPSYKIFQKSEKLLDTLRSFKEKGKVISAICAAPSILMKAGIIQDEKITMQKGFDGGNNQIDKDYVISGNIVTGRNMESTLEFAKAIVKRLKEEK